MVKRRSFLKFTLFLGPLYFLFILIPGKALAFIGTRLRKQKRSTSTGPLPGLYAWGYNQSGRLGINSVLSKSSPVQVGTLKDWLSVGGSTDHYHSHAIKADGTLWSWGAGTFGEVGDGGTTTYSSPVQIGTLQSWIQVTSGDYYNHAIRADGTLWAWGTDLWSAGVTGTSVSGESYYSPTQVGTLNDWLQVSNGTSHSLAIKSNGSLWAWGGGGASGSKGDLGLGDVNPRSSPTQIGTLRDWVFVSGGSNYTSLAMKSDGTLWTWGSATYGQLGDGTTAQKSSPVRVGTLNNWVQASMGSNNALGLRSDGTLWSWGYNVYGQLGNDSVVDQSSPIQIGTLNSWISIAAGPGFNLGLQSNGTLWGWGLNTSGTLGVLDRINRSSPTQVGTLSGWVSIWTSYLSSFALRS